MPKLKLAKRERFCQEYIKDLNGTQAAIRAGYSKKTANEQAARMLTIVSIRERVQELQKRVSKKLNLTAEKVLQDIEDLRIQTQTENPQVSLRASELQGKHLSLFTDKTEISGPNGGPIESKFEVVFVEKKK